MRLFFLIYEWIHLFEVRMMKYEVRIKSSPPTDSFVLRTSYFVLCFLTVVTLLWCVAVPAGAQVYSPKVLRAGQVDTSNLAAMARGIFETAHAVSPRQKAEAIWRFFLTDGRFVKPGLWYHIAGWAYEEPGGEVLDPMKLVNSYGFGLCYQVAPLLEAVYKAGGFEDARVWFLTGHTVTEVYYEGAYHYYDSDMMGYSSIGDGNPEVLPVASVQQIARDGSIILSKLKSPTSTDPARVDQPWYPADLRAAAIGDLASLFTSTGDNWLYPFTRYPQTHTMEYVLRPGEKLIRYFQPESPGAFYLPFKWNGESWSEFPQEVAQFNIRTTDGPRSQKDNRLWSTGRIEYRPVLSDPASYYPNTKTGLDKGLRRPDPKAGRLYLGRGRADVPAQCIFEMRSPYVLIDARLSLEAELRDTGQSLIAEISVDGGETWEEMAKLTGPYSGKWEALPRVRVHSSHGTMTSVSGRYQFLVRLTLTGPGQADAIQVRDILLTSRFQLNPRTLPELMPGRNRLSYRPGAALLRSVIPVQVERLSVQALRADSVKCILENGQGILWPEGADTAELVYELSAPDGSPLCGFDAGARFLDLRDHLAPDKFTAETRPTNLGRGGPGDPEASIAWSLSHTAGYQELWKYSPNFLPRDGVPVDRLLRWPEIDRQVRSLPAGTRRVYVRYRLRGMGMDSPRLAVISPRRSAPSALEITHEWTLDGRQQRRLEVVDDSRVGRNYLIDIPRGGKLVNRAVIFYCPPRLTLIR